jgi:putative transposase
MAASRRALTPHHAEPPAMSQKRAPNVPLPKPWNKHVKSAVIHVISLAQYATAYTRSWAADSRNARVRLTAEKDRLEQELALLREEIRIKDARMARLPAHRRPQYTPVERMAILELKAARAWSLTQAAEAFFVTAETIASWTKRVDEAGEDTLVQITEPVNKFPVFVRAIVQRLKVLCPAMGKVKIAETLARAGLHLGVTTVGRILKEKPQPTHDQAATVEATDQTDTPASQPAARDTKRVVTAQYPNHVWHVDLTTVSILGGFWTSWLPFALPQCWPFCWWVAVVLDRYSRRMMGFAVFAQQPTSVQVRSLLGRTIHSAGRAPKYLICDKGRQFWCSSFKDWCRRRGIKPRYGAIGQHGSLAVIERFILTIKMHCTRVILVPTRRDKMREELNRFASWYNGHRPHMTLKGATPEEIYRGRHPTCRYPRLEPRPHWPRGAPCAKPGVPIRGWPSQPLELKVEFYAGRKHLPVVTVRRAA